MLDSAIGTGTALTSSSPKAHRNYSSPLALVKDVTGPDQSKATAIPFSSGIASATTSSSPTAKSTSHVHYTFTTPDRTHASVETRRTKLETSIWRPGQSMEAVTMIFLRSLPIPACVLWLPSECFLVRISICLLPIPTMSSGRPSSSRSLELYHLLFRNSYV